MIKVPLILQLLFSLFFLSVQSQSLQQIENNRILLPNRWGITQVGSSLPLGDLPLNIAVSKSKKLIAVSNNGQSDQTIQLIDAVKKQILDSIIVGKSWLGLAFSNNEKELYASGGNDNWIIRYDISNEKLIPKKYRNNPLLPY